MNFITKTAIAFIIALLVSAFAKAQLTGTLSDSSNEPIAFASIYIKGTYTGTTTNQNGSYTLKLAEFKTYEIVYQSLGYQPKTISIAFIKNGQVQNVVLEEEIASLETVVINSNENPADRVIREAIANREANRKKFSSYKADFYSRGILRMEDVPEKFLGQEIGDL
jgi:hypothetical protein